MDFDIVYKELLDGHKACKTTLSLTQFMPLDVVQCSWLCHWYKDTLSIKSYVFIADIGATYYVSLVQQSG